jgi:alpha-mannosidase
MSRFDSTHESTMKKTIHLVCNAHLDPVWQWTWEDGLAEAVSTFRIAADFCETHPDFVFNHNESLLYGWIKEHEPQLFTRIQKLVMQKRWHIAGGAFLQPDVNVPMGETHIRQFLYGLRFFKEHFKARPTTAYNFDPFGHPEGFAQILNGCGMDAYIFCRPDFGTYDMPVGCFTWMDRSGKSVTARRSDDHYLTIPGTQHDVATKFPRFLEHYKDEPTTMLLWGIGNHGGGVSRAEYEQILQYFHEHPEYVFKHSTPEAFIDHARKLNEKFPVIQGELERNYAGCYTSMGRVKQAFRAAEHLLLQTETQAALAWWFNGVTYPQQQLDKVWREVMFNTFHDILPGSGIPNVEKDALAQLGRATSDLRELRMNTLIKRVQGQPKAGEGEVPIFITNPHGFAVKRTVTFEYPIAKLFSIGYNKTIVLKNKGKIVSYQRVSSQNNLFGQWIVNLAVNVSLRPYEVLRLDASLADHKPTLPKRRKVSKSSLRFTTAHGAVSINPETGLIDRIIPKGARRSLVKSDAMQPVLFEDLDHSWTCGDPKQMDKPNSGPMGPAWKKPDQFFKLATVKQAAEFSPLAADKWSKSGKTQAQPIRLIEDGDLQTVVEVLLVCGMSAINRHYVINHVDGRMQIRDRIFYNHKDHMLKLHIPLNFKPTQSRSEACYSVTTRQPTEGYVEQLNKRWVAAEADNGEFVAVLNDASNAHNLTQDALAINVLRSPAYTSFIIQKDDPYNDHRFAPRQDQGEHERRYELVWGQQQLSERALTQDAMLLNAEPYACVYYPNGENASASPKNSRLHLTPNNVQITTIKKAHDSNALIIRLQELDGMKTKAKLYLDQAEPIQINVDAYSLRTIKIKRHGNERIVCHCNLVEEV